MESTEHLASRHRRRRLVALAVGALGALALGVAAAAQPPETWVHAKELAGRVTEWVRGLGAGWFFAAFAVLPAVGFPVSPFAFGAGPLFGPVLGLPTVLALAGASMAVSMSISYGLARHFSFWASRCSSSATTATRSRLCSWRAHSDSCRARGGGVGLSPCSRFRCRPSPCRP